jgi:uroporphyrinogen-III decarboxylase
MKETMSPKERWLAALRLQPVDRLPFWPKLSGSYPPAQEAPFSAMTLPQLQAWIGSDPHTGLASCIKEVRTRTSVVAERTGDTSRTVYACPEGRMEMIQHFDAASQAWHPVQFPVRTREDIRLMTRIMEDAAFELDTVQLEKSRQQAADIGASALAVSTIGTTPLMVWIEWLAGVEGAHFLLSDYPDEVESLFEVMRRGLLRKAELALENSPADAFYMIENTSTTLHSPEQFRRYARPVMKEVADRVRGAGKILILHMCGHLKAVLPDLAGVGAHAFEAFTAPTLGNTTLRHGRSACPDVCLVGGTHAMIWTQPADAIVRDLEQSLAALPHHRGLVITSAGVMPPLCAPATIRSVCDWVKAYPARLR